MKTCFLSWSKQLVGNISAENVIVAPCSTLWHAFVVVSWVPVQLKAKAGLVRLGCESREHATCSRL